MNNSNEMAKDRSDWARDRTIPVNERTLASRMHIGMALLAIAAGLKAVFPLIRFTFSGPRKKNAAALWNGSADQAASQPHSTMRTLAIAFIAGSITVGHNPLGVVRVVDAARRNA